MNLVEKGLLAIRKATDEAVELAGGLERFTHLQGHEQEVQAMLADGVNLAPGQLAFTTTALGIRATIRLKGQSKTSIEVEYSLWHGTCPDPQITVRWWGGDVLTPTMAVLLAEEHRKAALLGCQLEALFKGMANTLTHIEVSSCTPVDGRRQGPGVYISEILGRFHDETEKKLDRAGLHLEKATSEALVTETP